MFFACQRENPQVFALSQEKNKQQMPTDVHREIARREKADIQLIAKRYDWHLKQTPSGLLYELSNVHENSSMPQSGDIVSISGSISLPSGVSIFDSQKDSIKTFQVNRSEDFVGLHELLQLMHEGDSANAIIPSFLAYGLSGDGDKIGGATSLICKIKLVNINKK